MFDINFYSKESEFNRYSTEDLALLSIGLGNYNKSSVDEFFNPAKPNPDIAEFFGGNTVTIANSIRGIGLEGTMKILEFDIINKNFKETTGLSNILLLDQQKYPAVDYPPVAGDIKLFLDNWNKVQMGSNQISPTQANTYKVIVDKINNSVSGCISFKATFNVLGSQRTADIMLYLMYSRDNQSSRTVSFQGSPLISAFPTTAEGLVNGYGTTNALPIGVYGGPLAGGESNPKNTVTGKLRTVYDPTTGEFESGTQQILVRLVDDVEAASISQISGQDLLLSTPDQFYDGPESDLYTSDFKKGRAVPISMENGNPYMVGPNFQGDCKTPTNKSVIIVVNRSAQSFKSGQLVLCSKINGEWLLPLTGAGGDLNSKISFGNFEYQQYIIPGNKYFTFNGTTRMMPDDVARKIRYNFYVNLSSDPKIVDASMNDADTIKLLNIFVSTMPTNVDDPIEYIKQYYTDQEGRALITEANTENANDIATGFFTTKFVNELFYPDITFNEVTNSLPKNVLVKNGRLLAFGSPTGRIERVSAVEEPLYGDEVPFFWGMLFPDGYNGTGKFIVTNRSNIDDNPLFERDNNLRELSVLSTLSYPYIKDVVTNYQFIKKLTLDGVNNVINELKYIKKNSGIFIKESIFNLFAQGNISLTFYDHLSFNIFDPIYTTHGRLAGAGTADTVNGNGIIFGLEPAKPNRLQFSSMSIEHLYSKSLLNNNNFGLLRSSVDYYYEKYFENNAWASNAFGDILYDWWKTGYRDEIHIPQPHEPDFDNAYNLESLLYRTFNQTQAIRHPAPLGTAFLILPPNEGAARSTVMPILTCKSKIRTSAASLRFDTSQLFGMQKRTSVSPADINEPIILPIGGGIGWNQPNTPIQVNSYPQWGDRNRTDDIDSFGTTALHVRVFEGWPTHQTIYLGGYFTPLHFNASAPDNTFDLVYDQNGNPRLELVTQDGNPVEARSNVDFKIPTQGTRNQNGTFSIGSPLAVGAAVLETNLAPYSQWKWNKIRRAKLLTYGGFAYKIRYVGIVKNSISKKQDGERYVQGDKFIYGDGTTIKVTSIGNNGAIGNVEITEGEMGLTGVSTALQPLYLGSTGSGAVWNNVTFIVKERYGYDPGPKEVVPITKLTKSSNNGEELIEGNLSTSISLNNDSNTAKDYDIFYFYHNDPTHYSIDKTLAFNGAWAQYAIVEVNGGA